MSLQTDVLADLQERVRLAVAGGYASADFIVEDLVGLVEYDPETEALVAADREAVVGVVQDMVDARMAEHAAAEMAFPTTTDCDRVSAAFAQLETLGILAREDVGYTQSDIRDDMWELVEHTRAAGGNPLGWVAFHRQDVERVIDSGVLYLAYAASSNRDEDFLSIGATVATVLAADGLTVEWDNNPDERIRVTGLRWQRRRR